MESTVAEADSEGDRWLTRGVSSIGLASFCSDSGLLGAVQALGDLVATVVAGVLYTSVSASASFIYAACWMFLAVLVSAATRRWSQPRPGPAAGVS